MVKVLDSVKHYRIFDATGKVLWTSTGSLKNTANWRIYPSPHQLPEACREKDTLQVIEKIKQGEPCEFDIKVYATHREGCPERWHELHVHGEPVAPGETMIFDAQLVTFGCGAQCRPEDVLDCNLDKCPFVKPGKSV